MTHTGPHPPIGITAIAADPGFGAATGRERLPELATTVMPAGNRLLPRAALVLGLAAFIALTVPSLLLAEDSGATPFKNGERLRYQVVWPSGLSLGEAEFTVRAGQPGWEFSAELSASLPTFSVRDNYSSVADVGLCSQELIKNFSHGKRKGRESVVFDQQKNRATRTTLGGGGESEIDIPPCARDGLAYLYFLRQSLADGRIPPPDDVNFGGQYMVSVTYAETKKIEVGGAFVDSDLILVDLTGPSSQHSVEVFFSKDASRRPLLFRIPFDLGVFSLRLVE